MREEVQLTVRGVPAAVAQALRQSARAQDKSLNRVLVEALTSAAGLSAHPPVYRDLDWLAGTWVEDPEFDAAIAAQDQVDEEMWR